MKQSYLVSLGFFWVLWCCLHSLLITASVQAFIVRLLSKIGFAGFRYRLIYTIVAFATLLPLAHATFMLRGEVVLVWKGGWRLLEFALGIGALWLFYAGARHYDLREMLFGKEQGGENCNEFRFFRDGVHGVIRHPWYLGSLFFLWAWPVYHEATLLAALILSCYLLVGTIIEEKRLVAEFGETYRQYQREVSMLIPWKWLCKRLCRKDTGRR